VEMPRMIANGVASCLRIDVRVGDGDSAPTELAYI